MKALADIFGADAPDIPLVRRSNISFLAFGEDLGTDRDAPPLFLGMRFALDDALVRAALAAGAQDFTGRPVVGLDPVARRIKLPEAEIAATAIIAADGVNSPTAKTMFGRAFDRDSIGFALEVERPGSSEDVPLRIDFGAANWGYGWQFPKTTGTTVGVGGVLSRNADMKASLRNYCDFLGVTEDLPVKGQFLPFGAFRRQPGRGRVLLAGDAAGLVDPITGEGIAHALRSGQAAAQAVADALKAGAPDAALDRYMRGIAGIHRGLGHAGRLRHLLFRDALRPTFIRSFRQSRTLRGDYLRLLAGETEYGEIMRKMAFRLPSFAARALRRV